MMMKDKRTKIENIKDICSIAVAVCICIALFRSCILGTTSSCIESAFKLIAHLGGI